MIRDYLKQPYDILIRKWKLCLVPAIFVSLFMLFFQPFGIPAQDFPYKIPILLGYGGVTFLILLLNFFIITRVFPKWFRNWTILKQIIWLMWIVFTIGIINFVYTFLVFSIPATFRLFTIFQFYTLLIGSIPIIGITLITHMIRLSRNLKKAIQINEALRNRHENVIQHSEVILTGSNEKDDFRVGVSHLLFIESLKNYIEISFLENDQVNTYLLRSTIKRAESQLEDFPSVMKCHRAFIINTEKVISATGNSNGLQLTLTSSDKTIPVSQNNYHKIREALSRIL